MNKLLTLNELINVVVSELEKKNYAYNTICGYRACFKRIKKFADKLGVTHFSEEFGFCYLKEKYDCIINSYSDKQPKGAKHAIRSIRLLGDYQIHGVIIRRGVKKKDYKKPEQFKHILEAYDLECSRNNYSKRGLRTRMQRLLFFIDYLDQRGIKNVNEINAAIISDYVKTICHNHEKSMASILTTLRVFLRFLYLSGLTNTNQSLNVPNYTKYYYPKLPSVWNPDDVKKLLLSIDRDSPVGKRDYAILMMVAKLGIRVGDLKALKLTCLDWKKREIIFTQTKTGTPVKYPILDDVGWSLIDYLKNGRPKVSTSPYVFVRYIAPFESFGENANLHYIITKYTRKAGINIPHDKRHGLHSLRHTLASTLLEKGVPIHTITKVLGHVNSKSTNIYLHTDMNKLKLCALDPEELIKNEY